MASARAHEMGRLVTIAYRNFSRGCLFSMFGDEPHFGEVKFLDGFFNIGKAQANGCAGDRVFELGNYDF